MKYRKQSIRVLFFVFLLACLLTGLAGIWRVPARAAPQIQATACVGTTITQWTFAFDVGSGLSSSPIAFSAGPSGGSDRAVSFSNWTSLVSLDPTDYVELVVPT